MDDMVRQRVNEILNEKIAMGAGSGGYGTKKGARKAVATKRRIARARAPAKRAPAKCRAPVRRRCAAGEGYGGYGTAAGARKAAATRASNLKAKCQVADLKAETKELKAEVRALEKMIKGTPPPSRGKLSALQQACAAKNYRGRVCKKNFPTEWARPTSSQDAARVNFAAKSKMVAAMMAEHKMAGQPISRQEAWCMVNEGRGKNCHPVELIYEPPMMEQQMAEPVQLVRPGEVVPQEMMIGTGGRYGRRRGRGDMGYGTLIY